MTSEQLTQAQVWAAAIQAAATIVLVVITGFYAKQNRDMAREMRRARELQVAPHLMPTMRYVGAGIGFLSVGGQRRSSFPEKRTTTA
jgi:ribosomal protein S18